MTTSPKLIPEPLRPRYEALEAQTRLARYGGDCYAYCMLAAGPCRSRGRGRAERL